MLLLSLFVASPATHPKIISPVIIINKIVVFIGNTTPAFLRSAIPPSMQLLLLYTFYLSLIGIEKIYGVPGLGFEKRLMIAVTIPIAKIKIPKFRIPSANF
jgi:hypothetical protein